MPDRVPRSIARGFLFADLRGYSAFVERHGDRAGADLLVRYRDLVRGVVRDFAGAEIRTEGDSFYVAFDSPSGAVHCALAILAAASESPTASGKPIAVGIGVHVGETVELDEGYVGSAVNIAARVCAQAPAGEVLVTDAVRSLTHGVLAAQYVPVGRRRLKGISEPVALFRALPAGSPDPRSRFARLLGQRSRPLAFVLGVSAISVAIALAGAVVLRDARDQPSPAAASTPTHGHTVEPTGSPSPNPRAEDGFPTAGEARHIELVDPAMRDRCGRAEAEDGPRFPALDTFESLPLVVRGGVHCTAFSTTLPHDVWFWEVGDAEGPSNAEEWIVNYASWRSIPAGSCDAESTAAFESWSFNGRSGRLLCVATSTGEAVVHWTYTGSDVIGKAVRRDGDMRTLLAWWRIGAPLAVD